MTLSKLSGPAIATVCGALLATAALACGDKLVAMGGGVGFERVMVSRNPGHIILMLEPSTGLATANEKFNLADYHRGIRASAHLWEELAKVKG